MDDAEYLATQQQIILFAKLIRGVDVQAFLERINRAESIGPVLDPTMYRKAAPALDTIKGLAEALLPFHEEAVKVGTSAEGR